MSICETSPASEAPQSAHAQSLRKLIAMIIALLILTIGFFLTIAPTVTTAPTSMNIYTSSAPTLAGPFCGGDAPGFCPNPKFGFAN